MHRHRCQEMSQEDRVLSGCRRSGGIAERPTWSLLRADVSLSSDTLLDLSALQLPVDTWMMVAAGPLTTCNHAPI